jgi:hypothetical protein
MTRRGKSALLQLARPAIPLQRNRSAAARRAPAGRVLGLGHFAWLLAALVSGLLGSLAASFPRTGPGPSPVAQESLQVGSGSFSSRPVALDLAAANARVRAMDQEQLYELRRKRDTFYSLPPARQEDLRKLAATIDQHPNRDRLLVVLQRFYSWYRGLDPLVQSRILDETDLEKRVAMIQDLLRDQSRDINILPFSNRDLELVEKWVEDFSGNRRDALRKLAGELAQSSGDNPGVDAMIRMMFRGDIAPDALFRRLINFAFASGRNNLKVLALVTDEDLRQLFNSFSPEGQTHIPEGREAQLQLLWTLVRRPYASDEDLHKFYVQELTPDQRDRLDRMSPERMTRELRQLYIQKKYQLPPRRGGGGGLPSGPPRAQPR